VGFWNRISTERKFELLQQQLDDLKRDFRTITQEWDATADRVAKTLRRIKRAEQAALVAEDPDPGAGEDGQGKLPLTTITGSPERMARIREQLAAKGR
jgi:hypothetical protein